jgi:hypothetical protein
VLFLVCLVFQRMPEDLIPPQWVRAPIIILGWFLAPFINLAAGTAYLVTIMRKKTHLVPVWLVVTNLLFFLFQILKHFILA